MAIGDDYYNPNDKVVFDGDIAQAADLNNINTAVDTAFESVSTDLVTLNNSITSVSEQAEKWATDPQGTNPDPLEPTKYSSKAYAEEAEAWASGTGGVSTEADGTTTIPYSANEKAVEAAASASNAATSESNAATSASNASTSETNAATSESNAATSASNALTSENKAADWAEEDEDVEVELGKYSAKHWAAKSKEEAAGSVKSVTGTGVDNTDPTNPVISLGTAALEDVTTSTTDSTLGHLLKVGDFGLGYNTGITATGDWDSYVSQGIYRGSGLTNAPSAGSFQVVVWPYSSITTVQVATLLGSELTYIREQDGGTWSSWRLVYTQATVVGTVSQSSGIPTGAVIEYGPDIGNGQYIRFADGTMVCWANINTLTFNPFQWTFPSVFSAVPRVTGIPTTGESSVIWMTASVPTTTSWTVRTRAGGSNNTTAADSVELIAIGRWF